MAPHSSTLAWKIPWREEPGRLQFMGSWRVGQDWATSLSLFTFMHWRGKWQPTPVFLPGESQGRGSLVGCHLWGWTRLKQLSSSSSRLKHIFINQNRTVWITINCGKFWERWEYQTTWPASSENYMQIRKQQLELDMKQQTGSKQEKEYIKAVYCHPAYLTSMQSTSWEMLGWRKHKLESRLPGEISITSDMQMTPSLWQKVKKN